MHRVNSGSYIGQPSETATLATETDGGGQVMVTLDGQDMGSARQFDLTPTPGGRRTLTVRLAGPLGASCVVTVAVVDGSTDGDFLICQAHDPVPIHTYTFDTAAQESIAKFVQAVGTAAGAKQKAAPKKKNTPPKKRGGR